MKTILATAEAPPAPPSAGGYATARPLGLAAQGSKLPKFGDRTRPFLLGAHYSSWELVQTSAGWRLVPTLKPYILKPGVNWTKAPGKGQAVDRSELEAKASARWGVQILRDLSEYLVEVDGDGAPGIFLRWERVRVYQDGNWSVDTDTDAYDLWRASLVAEGRVEAPRDEILNQLRLRAKNQRRRATRTPHLAQAQEAIKEADARLAGLEEALAHLRGETAAKSKGPAKPKGPPSGRAPAPADEDGDDA